MNYGYKNYLYIYNIKLIKENISLITKTAFKCIFYFIYSKKFFLLFTRPIVVGAFLLFKKLFF